MDVNSEKAIKHYEWHQWNSKLATEILDLYSYVGSGNNQVYKVNLLGEGIQYNITTELKKQCPKMVSN